MACPICICRYRKGSVNTQLACPGCLYTVCASCTITWIAQTPGNGCMSCRAIFTDAFIFTHVPKRLQKEYDISLAKFKRAAEQAYMPITKRTLARKFTLDRISRDVHLIYQQINVAEFNIRTHRLDLMYLHTCDQSAENKQQQRVIRADVRTQTIIIRTLRANNSALIAEYRRVKNAAIADIADPVYCANPAGMCGSGGILDDTRQCPVCAYRNCPDCGVTYADTHQCVPENLATVALLRHDTKPCPRCYVPIHKASGCDHMWCPRCHVEFDWHTLAVSNIGDHNPDRIDYLARMRQLDSPPDDMLCDVLSANYRPLYQHAGYPALCSGIIALQMEYRRLLPIDDNKYAELRHRIILSGATHPVTAHVYPTYTDPEYIRDIVKIRAASRWAQIQADILYMCYAGLMSLMGELMARDTYAEMAKLRKLANTELKRASVVFSAVRYKLGTLDGIRPLHYSIYAAGAI